MKSPDLTGRAKIRKRDAGCLELMIAEIEDMKTRHLSAYFKIKCNEAIAELKKAQTKLIELNEQFEAING